MKDRIKGNYGISNERKQLEDTILESVRLEEMEEEEMRELDEEEIRRYEEADEAYQAIGRKNN